jgi:hypothetical protein
MVAANETVQLYALFIGILGGPKLNHGSAFGDRDSDCAAHNSAATALYNMPFACSLPRRCHWQCHPNITFGT